MQELTFSSVISCFLRLEESYKLFDLKEDGVHIWRPSRFAIFSKLIDKENNKLIEELNETFHLLKKDDFSIFEPAFRTIDDTYATMAEYINNITRNE